MTNIFLTIFLWNLAIFGDTALKTNSPLIINGAGELSNQTIDSDLVINGAGSLEKVKINGLLEVNGAISITESSCLQLRVNGALQGHGLTVAGNTRVNGAFSAINSSFKNIEIAAGDNVSFENSVAEEITVKSSEKETHLILSKTSKIKKVIFESGNGIVKKDDGSTIETIIGEKK
jgi:hypothetical protein